MNYRKSLTKRIIQGKMIKKFSPYLKNSIFFNSKDLYEEALYSRSSFKNANLYFIVELEKISIITDKVWEPLKT